MEGHAKMCPVRQFQGKSGVMKQEMAPLMEPSPFVSASGGSNQRPTNRPKAVKQAVQGGKR
jgi:hypothetical protein